MSMKRCLPSFRPRYCWISLTHPLSTIIQHSCRMRTLDCHPAPEIQEMSREMLEINGSEECGMRSHDMNWNIEFHTKLPHWTLWQQKPIIPFWTGTPCFHHRIPWQSIALPWNLPLPPPLLEPESATTAPTAKTTKRITADPSRC